MEPKTLIVIEIKARRSMLVGVRVKKDKKPALVAVKLYITRKTVRTADNIKRMER